MRRGVLIISASMGAGHDGAARELRKRLEAHDHDVTVVDFLTMMPFKLGAFCRWTYETQLKTMPWSYELSYKALGFAAPVVWGPVVRLMSLLTRRAIKRELRRTRPDAVVSTYPLASLVLGRMRKKKWLRVPVATYLTDFAVHPLWVHPGVDLHLAVSPVSAETAGKRGGHDNRASGPLVADRFRTKVGRPRRDAPAARHRPRRAGRAGRRRIVGRRRRTQDVARDHGSRRLTTRSSSAAATRSSSPSLVEQGLGGHGPRLDRRDARAHGRVRRARRERGRAHGHGGVRRRPAGHHVPAHRRARQGQRPLHVGIGRQPLRARPGRAARRARGGHGRRCGARRDDRRRSLAVRRRPDRRRPRARLEDPRRPARRALPDAQGPAPDHDRRRVAGRPLPAADDRRPGRRRARCRRGQAAEGGHGHRVPGGPRDRGRGAHHQRRGPDPADGDHPGGRRPHRRHHRSPARDPRRRGHPHRQRGLGPEPLPALEPCPRRLPEGGADDRADRRDPGSPASSCPAAASTASTSSTAAPAS